MSCIVKSCRNSRWLGEHTITFHRFVFVSYILNLQENPKAPFSSVPKDPLRRAQWADNCNVPIQDLKPLSFVCSDHFEADCFKIRDGRNKILTIEAAPTVFNVGFYTFWSAIIL
jgi:THAP domain